MAQPGSEEQSGKPHDDLSPEYFSIEDSQIVVALPYQDLVTDTINALEFGVVVADGPEVSEELGLALLTMKDPLEDPKDKKPLRLTLPTGSDQLNYEVAKGLIAADPSGSIIEAVKRVIRAKSGGWVPTMGRNRTVGHLAATNGRVNSVEEPTLIRRPGDFESLEDLMEAFPSARSPHVGIGDTALWKHSWYERAPIDVVGEPPVAGSSRSSHSTFIAGLVLAHAPTARLTVNRMLDSEGVGKSWDVAKAIVQFNNPPKDQPRIDILNLSFSCYTSDAKPPLALATAIDRLHPEIVVVAGAGNYADRDDSIHVYSEGVEIDLKDAPAWPAALDDVVAVGANRGATRERAAFSPDALWVDTRSPGDLVVSTFAKQSWVQEEGQDPRPDEDGWATWNGTSFSTAIVTGLIAAEMARHDVSARTAWSRLRPKLTGTQSVENGLDIKAFVVREPPQPEDAAG